VSTVTYIGDEPREVAILPDGMTRVIQPDQKFTVPDEFDASYACQPALYEVDGMSAEDAIKKGAEHGVPPSDEEIAAAPSQPAKKTAAKAAPAETPKEK
jgi:hypothetical protein